MKFIKSVAVISCVFWSVSLAAAANGPNDFEIIGPLAKQAIMTQVPPDYQTWAKEPGNNGSIRLFFRLSTEGNVLSGTKVIEGKIYHELYVVKSSGVSRLDEMAMDTFKQWKFAPIDPSVNNDTQFGFISFSFHATVKGRS